ncbi:AHH domain-containing protein [Vibrio cincinnatiensis]|uniref:AHH domain-containing protein n=1 Tax=Vibrio cincinnatiensis TaxID=675 RepID=UPI001EDED13A|nr:AHH domain-containing protein [Vibrio cincinnatiensis]MCG3726300.1 hypothetical protein [Vibrio cincinnatiensis]
MATLTKKNTAPIKKPPRPSNPSALEMTVYRYQLKAYDCYQKLKNKAGASKQEIAQLEEDIAFLKRDRARISAHARYQEYLAQELDEYRKSNKEKDEFELAEEKHHPTDTLSKNLYAVAESQPSPNHAVHHIIMGKGRHPITIEARLTMFEYGIGINDAINGVWLPRSSAYAGHYTTPKAPPHSRIHRYNYEIWVGRLARIKNNEAGFKIRLGQIKSDLKNGTHPTEILETKKPEWKPN